MPAPLGTICQSWPEKLPRRDIWIRPSTLPAPSLTTSRAWPARVLVRRYHVFGLKGLSFVGTLIALTVMSSFIEDEAVGMLLTDTKESAPE